MKKAMIIFFLFCINIILFCQNKTMLIGEWQAGTKEISSMYLDTYQFFNNGKFIFKPNAYNGLNRIISINGIYRVFGDTIYLIPQSSKAIYGGNFERSMITTLSDTWAIDGGKIKMVNCKRKNTQSAYIKIFKDSLILGDCNFYKVGDN